MVPGSLWLLGRASTRVGVASVSRSSASLLSLFFGLGEAGCLRYLGGHGLGFVLPCMSSREPSTRRFRLMLAYGFADLLVDVFWHGPLGNQVSMRLGFDLRLADVPLFQRRCTRAGFFLVPQLLLRYGYRRSYRYGYNTATDTATGSCRKKARLQPVIRRRVNASTRKADKQARVSLSAREPTESLSRPRPAVEEATGRRLGTG